MDIIRKMTVADVDGVCAIELECFTSEAWPREDFEALCGDFGEVYTALVYLCGGEVKGYIAGSSVLGELEIFSVAVDVSFRRRGVAKALIAELERLEAPETAYLEVRESNAPARSLYASLGFKEYGRRQSYYSSPEEDAVLMKKEYNGSGEL